ncbi:hypothetical protein [Staphylococcus phage vB_SepM_ phiIPLA-C1C]|uniref:Uncharacterized protein n=1 Tax=Staphylococcus phage vB_SepM_ phiIPLA-C1C TaxID=1572704 RepID=A0A0D3MVR8_9CAUD|nr:hypothetical protein AVU40_gp163 [Staphylococcus phage phiIPLA-C1C]AJA42338.1 hypothetical protein [Staphylococcus phage phiIPLA-C1C]
MKDLNNKELSYVELILENCDFVKIPSDKIDYMELDGITRKLTKHYFSNIVLEGEYCSHFNIEINNPKEIKAGIGVDEKLTAYHLLMDYPDITVITLGYEDGSAEDYRVYFSGDSYNEYQHTNYDAHLDVLSITVDKDYDLVE